MGNLIDRLLFRLNLNAESRMYKIGFQSLVATIYENSRKYFTNSLLSIFFISLVLLKKIREKEIGFLFVSSLSFFLILFLFSNITWIHDFFVLFLVFPIATFSSVFLNRINLHKKEKAILLLTLIAVFLLESYHSYAKIHQWFITSPPIVKFVAENKGNFLVTYYENPDYHQFRFYSDLRKTKMVRDKEEFLRELLNEDYNYIIVMPEKLDDKNFLLYLRKNFRSVKVSNEYEVFYLK